MPSNPRQKSRPLALRGIAAVLLAASLFSAQGCQTEQVFNNGPQIDEQQLALVPVGSSRDQVLLALGTPSTTGTFDNEVFYYISQQRRKTFAYQKPQLVDQRVLAIYFTEDATVERVANYGLQDGKIFDFISRTTPTGGKDLTFLGRLVDFTNRNQDAPPTTSDVPGSGPSI